MSSIAYALRAEHHDTYLGGVVAIGDGSLDIRQELENGNGFIVVPETDITAVMVLDLYPPLERVPAPDADHPGLPVGYVEPDAAAAAPPASVKDLREQAKALGIENPGRSREDIEAAITAHVTAPPDSDNAPPAPGGDASATDAVGDGTAPENSTEG